MTTHGNEQDNYAWQSAEEECESPFIKLGQEPVYLQFTSAPQAERKHFINGKPHPCGPDDSGAPCSLCLTKNKADDSFKFEVRRFKGGLAPGVDKVLGLSKRAMQALLKARQAVGDAAWPTAMLLCSKNGSGPGTTYSFVPTGKAPVSTNDDLPF